MDEKRTDLRAALRELAAEEAAEIGPHAGLKRLIAYRRDSLSVAEREALQEHLSLCPKCAERLLELRDFEAASAQGNAAGPESFRQEAWESLAWRLPWKVSAIRPIAGAARREVARRRPHLAYGATAALLLAVVGLAVWTAVTAQQARQRLARLEQRLEEREEALAAARRSLAEAERQLTTARRHIQDLEKRPEQTAGRMAALETRVAELTSALEELRRTPQAPQGRDRLVVASQIEVSVAPRFALRGQEDSESGFLRGGGAVNHVRIPPQADRFTVALSLADDPVYGEYRLELMDRDGQVLWTGRRPGKALLGDAGTSVSIDGLRPGPYRLRIEGLHPDRTELLAEYVLAVEHQEIR
ncbi:MAG TPA: hypothetical protein VF756_12400 [Thermoanaerobaculia bacterium]